MEAGGRISSEACDFPKGKPPAEIGGRAPLVLLICGLWVHPPYSTLSLSPESDVVVGVASISSCSESACTLVRSMAPTLLHVQRGYGL